MDVLDTFWPPDVFAPESSAGKGPRRAFIAPQRYLQGPGVLAETGRLLALVRGKRAGVLISERGERTDGPALLGGLTDAGVGHTVSRFGGECSPAEIDRHVGRLRGESVDCLLAVGGGKCIDAGKAVAFRLGVPVVVIPTLASNDAPCSALSVIYNDEHVSTGVEFFPDSPALVIVDTQTVAGAPARYLAAGIGDAMATWYEADACARNEDGVVIAGTRPTLAALAIARAGAQCQFDQGVDAMEGGQHHRVDPALENVVEANTLMSGLGFESGGLAGAHAFAQAFTALPRVAANFLHGEMVAMGVLGQLALESRPDDAMRVAELFARVGLPVHLGQLDVDRADDSALDTIVEGALEFPFIGNMPVKVDGPALRQALLDADSAGRDVAASLGEEPYRRLR